MKKTYNKLTSDLLLVETEEGFMGCSVWSRNVQVHSYVDNTDWIDAEGNSVTDVSEWGIGFGNND